MLRARTAVADSQIGCAPISSFATQRALGRTLKRLAPLLAAAGLALLILLPFIIAAVGAPAGYVFRGTLEPSGDESQYLAAVRMGMAGDWLWHDPYMAHTPPAILMYPPYLAAGHAAALLGLHVAGGFALLHLVTALVLFGALWGLGSKFLSGNDRFWFVAFALGAGGLYWLVAVLAALGRAPTNLSGMGGVDLSGFTALLAGAHQALGVAGQCIALTGLLGVLSVKPMRSRWIAALYGGVGTLLVGLAFPVLLPLTVGTLALSLGWYVLWHTRPLTRRAVPHLAAPALLICMPGLLLSAYYYRVFSHGVWATGAFRSVAATPLTDRLLLWGVLLPFGWWGWRRAAGACRLPANLLAIWVGCALIGAYLPFWQGDRYTSGISVALGALFALGLIGAEAPQPRRKRWLVALSFGALCQYLFLCLVLFDGQAHNLYATAEEYGAQRWIAAHAGRQDVVLAPLGFANTLPIAASSRVVVGHTYQTLDFAQRLSQLATVYGAQQSESRRRQALRASGATLVVYDRHDDENGSFDPRVLPGLRLVYSTPQVAILRVLPVR